MLDKNFQDSTVQTVPVQNKTHAAPLASTLVVWAQWLLFAGNLIYLLYYTINSPSTFQGNFFQIQGFTVLIFTTVTFFSGLIGSYAKNYLNGSNFHTKFMLICLGFTLSVMLFVASNHILLSIFSWGLMGFLMSRLIGIDSDWGEAREASKFTLRYFLTGTLFLSAGLLILAFASESLKVSVILDSIPTLSNITVLIAALCIVIASIVQSAIYPFHRWLLSAMTAPTPASALMHAGFVNGAGILLALFSTVLFASNTLALLLIIGGLTAVIAQFTKLLQVNVKQKLACSTIAQMGFMIMQCGLGFFTAAVAHLILHGFYKAYLFLSSGEEIARSKPEKSLSIKIKPLQAVVVLFFGILGAILFALMTGKGTEFNSGIFLTLIVAITVGQATYNIVKERSLTILQKTVIPPVLFFLGIGSYALIYNGVSSLMSDMPMVAVPLSLSPVHIIFGIVFLIGFFIMKLGIYRKIPWLYVELMNLSQPSKKSILLYKSK